MKTIEVTGNHKLEIKRFSFPLVINCKCPKCATINEYDFEDSYLTYPKVNEEQTIQVYCDDCSDYFPVVIILKIAIELATEPVCAPKCITCGWIEIAHRNGFCYHYSDEDTDYFYKDKKFKSQ
jgi:phage FluMu protein Com